MTHAEQVAFTRYLSEWLEDPQGPLRCPVCQGPVSKGPAYLKAQHTMYQCVRRCVAISVTHTPLAEALFRVFHRVYEELRIEAAEQAPTVRPPPILEIDGRSDPGDNR